MADILNLQFPNGSNLAIIRSEVIILNDQTSSPASDITIYTRFGGYELKYGSRNPELWSQAKTLFFGNDPIVDFELPSGKSITYRKDAILAIVEVAGPEVNGVTSSVAFQVITLSSTPFAISYGGDNPVSLNEAKALIFGP